MKIKKLIAILLFPLLVGLVGCSVEDNKDTSSNPSSVSSVIVNNSTSTDKPNIKDSTSDNVPVIPSDLPDDAKAFVEMVNAIVLNEDAGYYIFEAYAYFESLDNWDYPEVDNAFKRLIELEVLYNDYLDFIAPSQAFMTRVDNIPYNLTINDERLIVLAEEAYSKLTEEQKSVIGVSQAYERLLDARADFDVLYAESIENAKKEAAKGFIDLVDVLPEADLLTLNHETKILEALDYYFLLTEEVQMMDSVLTAYEKLVELSCRLDELKENPTLNDDVIKSSFVAAVEALPKVDEVTLADRNAIFEARALYKTLPLTAQESAKDSYDTLISVLKAYYDAYLEANGLTRPVVDETNVTLIRTLEDLLNIKNNLAGNYRLANDINLNHIDWTNLGVFTGTLDGAGYSLYNMASTTYKNNGDTLALFLEVRENAVVKNLTVEGYFAEANTWSGVIAVRNYGTITNCLTDVDSDSISSNFGGIVCENKDGASSKITNCLSLGEIRCGNSAGGLAVGQYDTATLTSSYFCKDNVNTGLAVGDNRNNDPTLGKTDTELKTASTYANWDKTVWCIVDGEYPTLIV